MKIHIYIEGGGDGSKNDTLFREAWTKFFNLAGLSGRMPSPVRGGGRKRTFDDFATAVAHPRGGILPLLLVDSEGPVVAGHSVWEHLNARDGWERPSGASDDQAFLMVQFMETWFLADRDLIRGYFGHSLREGHLHSWPELEAVPKDTVVAALKSATAACPKHYAKGKISFELLGRLRPDRVEVACPHAKAFLERLRCP